MFRIDAALKPGLLLLEIVLDATGSPVSIYVCTIERRISAVRGGSADSCFICGSRVLAYSRLRRLHRPDRHCPDTCFYYKRFWPSVLYTTFQTPVLADASEALRFYCWYSVFGVIGLALGLRVFDTARAALWIAKPLGLLVVAYPLWPLASFRLVPANSPPF